MKKVNLLLFYTIFIIYEELVLSLLLFSALPKNILLIALFSIPIAIILSFISNIFKEKGNKIITYIITLIFIFLYGAQVVYYTMYESMLSFYSIVNGGQVAEFINVIIDMIVRNWYGIVALFTPLIILIIMHAKRHIEFTRMGWKGNLIKLALLILAQLAAILCVRNINTEGIYSNYNLYYNIHVPKLTTRSMGFLTDLRLDFQRFVFGFEEQEDEIEFKREVEEVEEEKNSEQYNIIEIDFDRLIDEENDEQIKQIHEYMRISEPSNKNKYTGMFKDKNLIVIVGESFSSLAIRKDLTPNLNRLYEEGFQFENFYTPIFPVSTADGEYITDTSLLPKEGVWSFKEIIGNYMPYSYANVFEGQGYSSNSYHNHTATYYKRDKYLETMGYNSYLAVGNGLEDRMVTDVFPNSDYKMVDVTIGDYINNDKFLAYYMTVSGHLSYDYKENEMVRENWDKVKSLPYSDRAKGYLATNIELDKAVGRILEALEQTGKLEDTVIVISGDHYPYGLTIEEINELSKYKRDSVFEKFRMPLLIWSGSMKEPIKVSKLGSSLDILPTVLNLFGVEFDSRLLMGRDLLSDSEPLVILADRSFITNKGKYNAMTGRFTRSDKAQIEEGYVDKINNEIYKKFQISRLILEKDYYKVLFNNI